MCPHRPGRPLHQYRVRGMLSQAETHYRKLLLVNFVNRSAEKLKAKHMVPPEYAPVPGTEMLSVGLEQGAASRGAEYPLQPHRPGLQQEWSPR